MNIQDFLKDPDTNWKYIAVVSILSAIVLAGVLIYQSFFPAEPEAPAVKEAPVTKQEGIEEVEDKSEEPEETGVSATPSQLKIESCRKCHLPTSDAGQTCADSDQCESYCQAPEGAEIGAEVTGQCYEFKEAICMQEIRGGIADAEWCH